MPTAVDILRWLPLFSVCVRIWQQILYSYRLNHWAMWERNEMLGLAKTTFYIECLELFSKLDSACSICPEKNYTFQCERCCHTQRERERKENKATYFACYEWIEFSCYGNDLFLWKVLISDQFQKAFGYIYSSNTSMYITSTLTALEMYLMYLCNSNEKFCANSYSLQTNFNYKPLAMI